MNIMEYMFDEENNKRLFGLEQRNEGKIEGRIEGIEEGQKLTAINLINMNMDISVIEKATGLSKAEIIKLKDKK